MSATVTPLPAPLNVSPLIRFSRYSLLIAGIAYGAVHHTRIAKKEQKRRAKEAQMRIENAPRLAAEKLRAQEEEFANLAKAGLKLD